MLIQCLNDLMNLWTKYHWTRQQRFAKICIQQHLSLHLNIIFETMLWLASKVFEIIVIDLPSFKKSKAKKNFPEQSIPLSSILLHLVKIKGLSRLHSSVNSSFFLIGSAWTVVVLYICTTCVNFVIWFHWNFSIVRALFILF